VPDSITVNCNAPLVVESEYINYNGHDRVLAALRTFDLSDLLINVDSFSNWFRMGGRMEGDLVEASQIDDWERTLFSKVYTALSQQTDQE